MPHVYVHLFVHLFSRSVQVRHRQHVPNGRVSVRARNERQRNERRRKHGRSKRGHFRQQHHSNISQNDHECEFGRFVCEKRQKAAQMCHTSRLYVNRHVSGHLFG